MDKSKISIVISRSTLFLLVYSIVSFFIFYYNDPSSIFDTPDFYRSFDLILSNYIIFFLFFLIILVLVNISQSLKIQIFSSLIFFVISFILLTLFSGKYFIWVAVALTPYFIFLLLIFIMFYIPIFYLSKLFSDNQNVSTIISLLSLSILCFVVYANYNDLSVKQMITSKNNQMFDSIEECNAYIFSIRKNDCKRDWTILRDRRALEKESNFLNQIKEHQSFDVNLKLVPESENFQYFPPKNIDDIKIGNGLVARYGDTVTIKKLGAVINGKNYSQEDLISRNMKYFGERDLKLSLDILPDYDSYILGVIGMKVDGIRKITFKTSGFWIDSTERILVKEGEPLSYIVELVSLKKNSF